jgi:glycosyltransferase involved in cell wall biosynthesis
VLAIVPALSDGVLARIASRRFGVPYGIVFQDLMGLAASESGVSGGQRVHRAVRGAEGSLARGADAVAVIAEGFRPYLEASGVDAGRIHRLRNWNQIPGANVGRAETRAGLGWSDDAFVCLHAGNMGHKQGLECILATARIAADLQPELRFVFAGDGNRRRELEAAAVTQGLTDVQFLPSLGRQEYANMLAAADVLLLNQRAGMKNMAFPSKITSYVFSGTPIIAAVDEGSDAATELLPARAAHVIEPGRPDALLTSLRRLYNDRALGVELAAAARDYGKRHLTAEAALERWEAFAVGLADRGAVEPVIVSEAA